MADASVCGWGDDRVTDRVTITPSGPISGFLFSEWTAAWWQYVLSIPFEINPTQDSSGNQCALAQRGPIWFLVGHTADVQSANRSCTVPEGKALFFPLLNLLDVNTASQTADELRREIDGCMDAATGLLLVVDGQSIPVRRDQWRVRSGSSFHQAGCRPRRQRHRRSIRRLSMTASM